MSDSDSDDYGPALPPGFAAGGKPVIGPTLPPHLVAGGSAPIAADDDIVDGQRQQDAGGDEDDDGGDDGDVIGPVLPGSDADRRRKYAPRRPCNERDEIKSGREEWMTVVPKKVEKKLGLHLKSVTTFSKASGVPIDDDTDTDRPTAGPSQKELDIANALDDYSVRFLFDYHLDRTDYII